MDEGWKAVEVEPTVVETHRQRQRSPHRRRRAERRAGHGQRAPRQRQRGGPRDCPGQRQRPFTREAAEGQQSLFSWAQFMAEDLVKPKARSRKPKGSSPSLFDWALSLEQAREEELVGAGR